VFSDAKMRVNKNFLCLVKFNEVSCMFVLLDCVVVVCVSCLLNQIVNQHNPCTLFIMSLANATSYFKSIILATPPISNDLTFSRNKEPRFILTKRLFQII
jgi:hypothetical protein